jgi:hypothetical protein
MLVLNMSTVALTPEMPGQRAVRVPMRNPDPQAGNGGGCGALSGDGALGPARSLL